MFRASVKLAAATQSLFTVVSVSYGALGGSLDNQEPQEPLLDAKYYQHVTHLITNMYSGQGMQLTNYQPDDSNTWFGASVAPTVQIDDQVSFADPAAICQGAPEVEEAFRALSKIQPISLSPPTLVNVQPHGDTIALTYYLHQQYGGRLRVKSLCVVRVVLREGRFVVHRVEEAWNGVPLLDTLPFSVCRRINGGVSWFLTTNLVK